MSNYSQSTFFTPKDALTPGDPLKIIKGADIDPEFSAISTAIATKVDTAGTGLSKSSTTLNLSFASLTDVTPVGSDEFPFGDVSDSDNVRRATLTAIGTALQSIMNHDSLVGFVADEHVAHSSITLTAGSGLTGGGTIAANRTFNVGAGTGISVAADAVNLDVNGLTAFPGSIDTTNDQLIMYDDSAGTIYKVPVGDVTSSDSGFVPEARTLTAGSGLTGGGDLSANRTFNVGAGTGISVAADTVGLDTSNTRNVDHASVSITAGTGLSGGGTIASTRTINLDIDSLVDLGAEPADGDHFLVYDSSAGAHRRVDYSQIAGSQVLNAGKTSNSAATSDDTLSADTDLTLTVENGETYIVRGHLRFSSASGTPGYKVRIGANASFAQGTWHYGHDNTDITFTELNTGQLSNSMASNDVEVVYFDAVLTTNSTTLSVDWAQNISNATSTLLRGGSYITAIKVS